MKAMLVETIFCQQKFNEKINYMHGITERNLTNYGKLSPFNYYRKLLH